MLNVNYIINTSLIYCHKVFIVFLPTLSYLSISTRHIVVLGIYSSLHQCFRWQTKTAIFLTGEYKNYLIITNMVYKKWNKSSKLRVGPINVKINLTYMFAIKKRLLFFSFEFVSIYLNISKTFRNIIIIENKTCTSKLKFS